MSSEGEETILMIGNVKYKKKDGSLVMTRSRFAWSREGTSELLVNIPYTGIKSHKVSKEGSSKIQLQLVLPNEETMNFHFSGLDPKNDRSQVSDLLVQCISKSNTIQTNPEMEAKWKLLQDADLYRLYKDMVVSGVITAEEFWANRWIPNQDQQQSGLPSAFLVDIETVSGCNTVQYQLSTDVIENIFRTYPTVKERHSQLVPDKMSEEKFWVQFFQSHKFHQNPLTSKKGSGSSSSSSNSGGLFQECIEQDITAVNSKPSVSSETSLVQVPDNPYEDTTEDITLQVNKQLLQRCNQHSALVLNAIQSDHNSINSSGGMNDSSTDDLLQLAMGPSAIIADTPPTQLINVARQYLHDISQQDQHTEVISPSQAQSATRNLLVGGSLMGGASTSQQSTVSPLVMESLCRYQRSLSELLRHFWTCFPVVNSQLEQKMHRMIQCLNEFKEKQLLNEFKSQLSSATEISLLDPLLVAIETANNRYQDWTNKQK